MSTPTEQELIAAAVAPRVTAEGIEANIKHQYFMNVKHALEDNGNAGIPETLGCVTLCFLVLQNGYSVIGKSACVDPKNYNREIGEKFAYADAVRKIGPLMGYALADELAKTGGTFKTRADHELTELANKIIKLASFIGTPTFNALSPEEKQRLRRQRLAMSEYHAVLLERVHNMH